MLWPALPRFWVAHQEIVPWVTSCGTQAPLRVQIVRGWAGSVTSATTGLLAPLSTITASCPPRAPLHVDFMAAQAGTPAGLGARLGVATGEGLDCDEGDGDGLASGLGDSAATREGDGVGSVAAGCPPQAATSRHAATTSSWRFTAP